MNIRTTFNFVLPKGLGISVETGHTKVTGTMRLVKVKDLLEVERDDSIKRETGIFYVVLFCKVILKLGNESMVSRKTFEKMSPVDFAFLMDFFHTVNHQVIKRIPVECPVCKNRYMGVFGQLGEV
ncbi:MAG: hypothetical protein LBP76_11815 [Treponema sp.]|jgi:hypothetical protein|nr:hypothetical protein [Treponema sp.]